MDNQQPSNNRPEFSYSKTKNRALWVLAAPAMLLLSVLLLARSVSFSLLLGTGIPAMIALAGLYCVVVASIRDNERLTRDNERLTAMMNAKTIRDAEIFHDLRDMVNPIHSISQFLAGDNTPERQSELTPRLFGAVQLVLDFLDYMSQFPQYELGSVVHPIFASFDVRESIDTVVSLLEYRRYNKSVRVHSFVNEDVPKDFLSDRILFIQILGNLLSNAVKFSPSESGVVMLNVTIQRERLVISVEDQGKGINPELIDTIFNPFVTTENHHKKGMGLGLSIAQKNVMRLKGVLRARNLAGKGAIFTVILPVKTDNIL